MACFIRSTYHPEFGSGTAKELGREPTPIEVFTYTHMKDHDLNMFVDRRTVSVNENYTTARERLFSSQTDKSEAESRIDEQPLLSPDPDAVDDTLVTPPGTTVHPAGTHPGNSTSDHADEQPRRFDFGPF
ncbi:hypothetical protein JCGZ_18097 [Jatropha curcas]|uniref:Uncharacterized protein n=1 Tax=Jatropha curcas TaxID=180498 RepID=A0A067KEY3_JATCU|nr:hypothetical protein JCGZ_18097 [Jatropha curcas]